MCEWYGVTALASSIPFSHSQPSWRTLQFAQLCQSERAVQRGHWREQDKTRGLESAKTARETDEATRMLRFQVRRSRSVVSSFAPN